MMKALMILDREFPPDLRVENEIEALSTNGVEIHIACFTRKQKPIFENSKGFFIHRRPIKPLTYKSSVAALTFPFYFKFWKSFLKELFAQNTFDIIHIHDLPLVKVGRMFAKQEKIPLVADLHENWPAYLRIAHHTQSIAGKILSPNTSWVKYEKEILKEADHIIVVVDEAKERLVRMGLNSERISVVSNTLNLSHVNFPEKIVKNDIPVLFYAGGIHFHRGLQTVIEALSLIRDNPYHLHILGEGSYTNTLISLSKKLGVDHMVTFSGWKPYQEMLQVMSKSDFALIPHIKSDHTDSTIPHKLFQYMYAGIPVIASNCIPIRRILEETSSGVVFPSENPEALANLLNRLNETTIKYMGNNGKKWVEQKYNWEVDRAQLIKVYQSLSDTSNL